MRSDECYGMTQEQATLSEDTTIEPSSYSLHGIKPDGASVI